MAYSLTHQNRLTDKTACILTLGETSQMTVGSTHISLKPHTTMKCKHCHYLIMMIIPTIHFVSSETEAPSG